jgi:hypothetical protein
MLVLNVRGGKGGKFKRLSDTGPKNIELLRSNPGWKLCGADCG